jgi:hypothetical protein
VKTLYGLSGILYLDLSGSEQKIVQNSLNVFSNSILLDIAKLCSGSFILEELLQTSSSIRIRDLLFLVALAFITLFSSLTLSPFSSGSLISISDDPKKNHRKYRKHCGPKNRI